MLKYLSSNPTFYFENTLFRNLSQTISDSRKFSRQLSSLELYDNFTEVVKDGKLESILDVKHSLTETKDLYSSNNIIKNRIEAQDQSMSNIIDILQNLKENMVLGQSSSYKNVLLAQISMYSVSEIGKNLNSHYNGFYLFSGSDIATPPVGDLTILDERYNYYGNDEPLYVKITPTLELKYNEINASNSKIRELIGLMHDIKQADLNKDQSELLSLQKKLDGLMSWVIETRSGLENDINLIEASKQIQKREIEFLERNLSDEAAINEKNFGEITTKFRSNQIMLESEYKIITQVLSLNLVDFL